MQRSKKMCKDCRHFSEREVPQPDIVMRCKAQACGFEGKLWEKKE